MSEPIFLGEGSEPYPNDTLWVTTAKILGVYQDQAGALPENNPRRSDTLRILRRKTLFAIQGAAYLGS